MKKWHSAVAGARESAGAFAEMDNPAGDLAMKNHVKQWEASAQLADARVLDDSAEARDQPDVMAIYDVSKIAGPTRSQVQLRLTEAEQLADSTRGAAAWLSSGIKIQETQYVLVSLTLEDADQL